MKELGRSYQNTHNKRSLIQTSHICQRRRAAGRNQQVVEYKHTHTHTHTEELSFMKLKKHTKFGEESTCRFKIGISNLTHFELSTQKSQTFSL